MLDDKVIKDILPQSFPFVMIDRIVDFKKGESLTAIKNITGNEWIYEGQKVNPERRLRGRAVERAKNDIFPETLLIEAAAQAALMLYGLSKIKIGQKQPKYILGKSTADFKNFVYLGDQITIHALANKMLDTGGYSDITLSRTSENIGTIEIIYSVIR